MNDCEIEIRIADLFAAILKRAKAILCFALILALLGAGYGLHKARNYERTETGELENVCSESGKVQQVRSTDDAAQSLQGLWHL